MAPKAKNPPKGNTPSPSSAEEGNTPSAPSAADQTLKIVVQELKFRAVPNAQQSRTVDSRLFPMPKPRAYHNAFYEDGRVIVLGGWDGSPPSVVGATTTRLAQPDCELHLAAMEWSLLGQNVSLKQSMNVPMSLAATQPNLGAGGSASSYVHPGTSQAAIAECNGQLFAYGGWDGKRGLNVLSCFSTTEGHWDRVHPTAATAATLPSLTFATLCGVGKKLYLFGGVVNPPSGAASVPDTAPLNGDMFVFDLVADRSVECSVASALGGPSKRTSHTATVLFDNCIVIYGGRGGADGTHVLGDVALFDTVSGHWQLGIKSEGGGAGPCARYGHSAVRIEGKGIFIHGGISQEGDVLADGWLLTMETPTSPVVWRRVQTQGTALGARFGHAMVSNPLSLAVYVIGGRYSTSTSLECNSCTPPPSLSNLVTISQPIPGAAGGKRTTSPSTGAQPTSGRLHQQASGNNNANHSNNAQLVSSPAYLLMEFPEFRQPGQKTPSICSMYQPDGGPGRAESTSSKAQPIRHYQPLQP